MRREGEILSGAGILGEAKILRELLIGCGRSSVKKLWAGENRAWHDLVRLDFDASCAPDVVHDLNELPYPFADNEFDEIHAYEVLEHCGRQGDWRFFFAQFTEFWRILKPDGLLFGTCPRPDSVWAWADPSHSRVIAPESFVFLDQNNYRATETTPMSDYRSWYKADFRLVYVEPNGPDGIHMFTLQAVKP